MLELSEGLKLLEETAAKQLAERRVQCEQNFLLAATLRAAGFPAEVGPFCLTSFRLHVKRQDLTRLYRAVGKLRLAWKTVVSEEQIEVTLKCPAHPTLTVDYIFDVPPMRTEAGKRLRCKIKEVTEKRLVLVCE